MFQAKTIGREFSLNLEDLKKNIESHYNFKITTSLSDYLNGYINLNFPFESNSGKKIVRIFGDYSAQTQTELIAMKYLSDSGIPTSSPLLTTDDSLTVKYNDYYYSVFDFITGERPNYLPNTFYRIGQAVAKMQTALGKFPSSLRNDNRYYDLLKREREVILLLEQNKSLLSEIIPNDVLAILEPQLELFSNIKIPLDPTQPTHSDIFNFNLLDDGERIYILDFDYLGIGPSIIDSISYVAWDSITSSRTVNTPEVHNDVPKLLIPQVEAYMRGYQEIKKNTFTPQELYNTLIFQNIIDNIYNLEKAVKKKENMYEGYIRHWENIAVIKENKQKLLEIFSQN